MRQHGQACGRDNKVFILTTDSGTQGYRADPAPTRRFDAVYKCIRSCHSTLSTDSNDLSCTRSSCDENNPVGSEHIVVEKVEGEALGERWESMPDPAEALLPCLWLTTLEASEHSLLIGNRYFVDCAPHLWNAKSRMTHLLHSTFLWGNGTDIRVQICYYKDSIQLADEQYIIGSNGLGNICQQGRWN